MKQMMMVCLWWVACVCAAVPLVQDGEPRAQIVIAENPPRAVPLAAEELQTFIERISGAKLPIVTEVQAGLPVKLYVGRSAATDAMGLTSDGLDYGAYHLKSGDDYLVMMGLDEDFVPPEPYSRNRQDIPRMMEEWDELTSGTWGNPIGTRITRYYNSATGLYEADKRGSLNAVYDLLRRFGVRWYMPGELGEIVPLQATLELPQVDETVVPDYPMRYLYFSFFHIASREDVLWYLRQGLNHGKEVMGLGQPGHGSAPVHARQEMKDAHPEYYALWGGKREVDKKGSGVPCLSAPGLIRNNVEFVRAVYDIYDQPMVSVMPQDGYGNACTCELCQGKETLDRGWYGQISDYVWAYTEKVAEEVYKTHPDRWISCHAYGSYMLPPLHLDKLSPNVVVGLVHGRADFNDDQQWAEFEELVQGWQEKMTSGKFMRWVHYLHTRERAPTHGLPVVYPHSIDRELKALKGISLGDFVEVSFDGGKLQAPIVNHLNIWLTGRLYWDAEQDVEPLLAEYYLQFYGPAAAEMRAFLEHAEMNWPAMRKEVAVIDRSYALLAAAQEAAPEGSVYAARIEMMSDYMEPLKQIREKLVVGRKGNPELAIHPADSSNLTMDGKLDDAFWQGAQVQQMVTVAEGDAPKQQTEFKVRWADNAIVFGIRCLDDDMANLNVATQKDEDNNIWMGDVLELLLETQPHSYYQICVNPAGAVMDLDRNGGINTLWESQVEVATAREPGSWTVELRVPLTGDRHGSPDPLHGVAGGKPTAEHPFYFNLCRQRVRQKDMELTAWHATGTNGFHNVLKMGKLTVEPAANP